jgi:signal transduction histidine kinase/ligand-binding sensor domain-containing protein
MEVERGLATKQKFWGKKRFLFVSGSLWLLIQSAWAQPSLQFKRYDVQDGLSHNYIRKVWQDTEGFIWIATEEGLNKFNSYSFRTYKNIPGDTNSLSNHSIIDLMEDEQHNLWVGTWGGGLFVYNRQLDHFQSIRHRANQPSSLISNYVYSLYKDRQGRMWVGTDQGLDLWNPHRRTFTHYRHQPNDSASLSNNRVTSIAQDQAGKLWLGTLGGGVNHFDPQTGTCQVYRHRKDQETSLSADDVFCVFYDRQQRLWVGTWDAGLNLMEKPAEGFRHWNRQPAQPDGPGSSQIWAIAQDQGGQVWIGTDNGLALFHEQGRSFSRYQNDPFDATSLSGNSVKSLFVDRQNRLWVGTVNNGVCLYDTYFTQLGHHYRKLNEASLSHNDVSAIVQLSDGTVLIGTDGGGLNLMDYQQSTFRCYTHDEGNPGSLGSNKIKSLLVDGKGSVWIGFWEGGLDRFDLQSRTFTHIRKGNTPTSLNNNNVTSLALDQGGSVWLGTFGGGLNRLDVASRTVTQYTQQLGDSGSLSDKYVWAVLIDRRNTLWVGTSNGKLDVLDRKRNQFFHVPLQKTDEDGYAVQALFEDAQGFIWIGLEGGGLKRLNPEDLSLQTFTQRDGLPSNNINSIEEDKHGVLWLGTNQGIARFDPRTRQCQSFGMSEGVQGLPFNRQASTRLASGEFVFGGNNGFNLFHPDSLKRLNTDIPIVLTDFQLFNEPVPIRGKDSPLTVQINQTQAIVLTFRQSVFSVEYAALAYSAPEKIRYQYRLKGFIDEQWQQAGELRKVTYTNLDPGEYTFEVRTMEGTPHLRTLFITVTPPWWLTRWAKVLAGVLFAGALLGIYSWRSRNIRQLNQRLESQVLQRTLELQRVNADMQEKSLLIEQQKEVLQTQAQELAHSNNEIKLINQQLEERVEMRTSDLRKTNQELDNFVYRVSHDIRAPLSSVLGLVNLLENEKEPGQIQLYLQLINKSVHKLDGFVRDILDFSRNARTEVGRERIDFETLVGEVWNELQHMEQAKGIDFQADYALTAAHENDVRRLHIILRNLLSNAIKYHNPRAESSWIRLHIHTQPKEVLIRITDNGIGIAAEQIDRVFGMFHRASEQSNGSGLGLYIVKETVERLKGRIALESDLGRGTQLSIRLPQAQPEP